MTRDSALLAQLKAKADWHAREAERYRTAVEVVSAELPAQADTEQTLPVSSKTDDPGPTLQVSLARSNTMKMVATTINSDVEREWTISALLDAMNIAGWETNVGNRLNTVRTAVSRLADRGGVERVRQGVYRARSVGFASNGGASEPPTLSESGPTDAVEALI